jgi:hypothetical protein
VMLLCCVCYCGMPLEGERLDTVSSRDSVSCVQCGQQVQSRLGSHAEEGKSTAGGRIRHTDLDAEADCETATAMGLDFAQIAPSTKRSCRCATRRQAAKSTPGCSRGTSRVHVKAGCSICRGYKASETTSLAACKPLLAAQWHPTENGPRTPAKVTPGSHRVVWWLCPDCNYEWPARISSRALDGNGCTRCAGQVALPGDPNTLGRRAARPLRRTRCRTGHALRR